MPLCVLEIRGQVGDSNFSPYTIWVLENQIPVVRAWHWVPLPADLFCYAICSFKYWQEDANIYINTRSGIVYIWSLLLCEFFLLKLYPTWFHLSSIGKGAGEGEGERRRERFLNLIFFLILLWAQLLTNHNHHLPHLWGSSIYLPSEKLPDFQMSHNHKKVLNIPSWHQKHKQ